VLQADSSLIRVLSLSLSPSLSLSLSLSLTLSRCLSCRFSLAFFPEKRGFSLITAVVFALNSGERYSLCTSRKNLQEGSCPFQRRARYLNAFLSSSRGACIISVASSRCRASRTTRYDRSVYRESQERFPSERRTLRPNRTQFALYAQTRCSNVAWAYERMIKRLIIPIWMLALFRRLFAADRAD